MRKLIWTCSLVVTLAFASTLWAEEGILVLSVTNTTEEAIANVTLKCKGDAPPTVSDRNGTARLKLPLGSLPGNPVVLQVSGGDWVLISPWDGRVIVPPFVNTPQNFVTVVIAKKSDKQMLASAKAVEAMAARVVREVGAKLDKQLSDEERRLVLEAQAREFGLTPEEVDRAIREWSRKVTDAYQQGLAELYQQNYPKAVELLSDALDQRLKELQEAQNKAADAAFFLGMALYQKGQYRDSANAYKQALALRPDDPASKNNVAVSLRMAGELAEAERYATEAVERKGMVFGPYHPRTRITTLNLALIYQDQGKLAEAEQIFKQALLITERGLGPDNPEVASCLDFYAELLTKLERRAEAEEKRIRARAIRARHDQQLRDRSIAESKQLLATKEQQLGAEHAEVAPIASTLGSLYLQNKQPAEAEALFKRALAIREKTAGPNHPDNAGELQKLSSLYVSQGRFTEAEPLAKRALELLEQAFGAENQYRLLNALDEYARILRQLGRTTEAAKFEARAQEIRERYDRSLRSNPAQQMAPNMPAPPPNIAPGLPKLPEPKKPEKPKPDKPPI